VHARMTGSVPSLKAAAGYATASRSAGVCAPAPGHIFALSNELWLHGAALRGAARRLGWAAADTEHPDRRLQWIALSAAEPDVWRVAVMDVCKLAGPAQHKCLLRQCSRRRAPPVLAVHDQLQNRARG
jgi:hypothetical protein